MGYLAYTLTDESRKKVLSKWIPKYSRVICHHITYKFGVPQSAEISELKDCYIVGYAEMIAPTGEGLEALVCKINGTYNRPSGGIYHLTLSLDYPKWKPVDSNKAVAKDWHPCQPFRIFAYGGWNP